jgi:hypothetical protein
MKKLTILLTTILFFVLATPVAAVGTSSEITNYTSNTLSIITTIASIAVVFFIVKGGFSYITSSGSPEKLEVAKKTIRNALIGLTVIIASGFIISVFSNALKVAPGVGTGSSISITPINTAAPSDGLTQVLIDAVTSFIQNIVQSAAQPVVNGIIGFLTTTPSLLGNSVVSNFWLVSLGITDSLFVVVVALLGLQLMSATTLGFEEVELRALLPRVGAAFLGANISLFLADCVITTANALTTTVLNATGGLNQAWILDAINPAGFIKGGTPLIILIFLVLFLIVAAVLLLMYISRLIIISVAGVLSPFIFLLWSIPKFADVAEMAVKSYFIAVFTVFINVVTIQLASSFLTIPGNSNNSLVSILIAIGLFATLLKTPSFMMEIVLYASKNQTLKNVGRQVTNMVSSGANSAIAKAKGITKTAGKVVGA